jgi:hypothetical protein
VNDAELTALEFLAEHRCAIPSQVQALLGCSARRAAQRIQALTDAGFVRSERIFAGRPRTCRITASGLRAIGSRLTPSRLHLSHYEHDLGLGWLWLAARAGAFGDLAAIHSERSMRAGDARADPTAALGIGTGAVGPSGREQLHYPDLLVRASSGKQVAIELELTGKSGPRLAAIMLAYAADARIDAVLYLVPNRRLASRIERAACDAGIQTLVHVQPLAPSIQGAPRHAHELSRRPRTRLREAAR